jgi:hypothetical protein
MKSPLAYGSLRGNRADRADRGASAEPHAGIDPGVGHVGRDLRCDEEQRGLSSHGNSRDSVYELARRSVSPTTRTSTWLEVSAVPGTVSAYPERTTGGYYLDITPNRAEIARYGLNVEDVLMQVEVSIGGMAVARTIEGRERYTINVRYSRELRDDVDKLKRVLVPVAMSETANGRNGETAMGNVADSPIRRLADSPFLSPSPRPRVTPSPSRAPGGA